MKSRALTIVALVAMLAPDYSFSCGESLYRVGRGVAYRVYSAPLPGNLLFLATTAESRDIAEHLAHAGHQVRVITSPQALAEEVSQGNYDVVIAPFEQNLAVRESLGNAVTSSTHFLPIAAEGEEQRAASETYIITVAPDDGIKTYLKAVHRTLKIDA